MGLEWRESWDPQATPFSVDEAKERFGRFDELYEATCWKVIEPLLPPMASGRILEAGCGTGRWVMRLAPLGYQVSLADNSVEMIRYVRQRIERRGWGNQVGGYHVLDLADMDGLEDESFDLVLAVGGALSLCREREDAAQELHRVTRRSGYVMCDVANRYRAALDLVQKGKAGRILALLQSGRYDRNDGLTDHRFTPQELTDLLEGAGLEVLQLGAVCPLFGYLPTDQDVAVLDQSQTWETMQTIAERYSEEPAMVTMSGLLLTVERRP
jgi:SAM-dependent methyltransferase